MGIWTVKFESDSWETADCSCPVFQKEYVCKHTVGIGIRLGSVTVPREILSAPLGQKRGPGRPALARGALSMD